MEVNVVAPGAQFADGNIDSSVRLLHCIWNQTERKSESPDQAHPVYSSGLYRQCKITCY